jgi:hypothetical protein
LASVGSGAADIVQVAQRVADQILFPAALATDASDVVPRELLDALADAGLYGVVAPRYAGGLDADFGTVCAVQEALAGGCLTTAFLWAQHISMVRAVAASGSQMLRDYWLAPLASGQVRAGLALGGALPEPTLRARGPCLRGPCLRGPCLRGTSDRVVQYLVRLREGLQHVHHRERGP